MASYTTPQRPDRRSSKPLPAEQPTRSSKRKQPVGLPFNSYFLRKIGDDYRFMTDEGIAAWIVSLDVVLKEWKTSVLDVPDKRAQLLAYLEHETAGGYWEMLATDVQRLCQAQPTLAGMDRTRMNGTEDCAFTAVHIIQGGLREGKYADRSIYNTDESLKAATHLLLDIIIDFQENGARGYFAISLLGVTQPALPSDLKPLKHGKTSRTPGSATSRPSTKRQRVDKHNIPRPKFPGLAAGGAASWSSASRPRGARPTKIVVLRVSPERLRFSALTQARIAADSASQSDGPQDGIMQDVTAVDGGAEDAMATGIDTASANDANGSEEAPRTANNTTSATPESTVPPLDLSMLRPNFTGPFAVSDDALLSWLQSESMLDLLLEWKKTCFEDQAANESFGRAVLTSGWETTATSIAECACAFGDDDEIELNDEVPEGKVLLLYSRFTHRVMEANIGEGGFYDQFEGAEQSEVMDSTKTSLASVNVLLTAYADLELNSEGFFATLLKRYSLRSDGPAPEDAMDVEDETATENIAGRVGSESAAATRSSDSDVDAQQRISDLIEELDIANDTIRRQKEKITMAGEVIKQHAAEIIQRLAQIDRLKEDAADNVKAQRMWDHDRETLIKKLEAEVAALKRGAALAHPEVAGGYPATLYEAPGWMS